MSLFTADIFQQLMFKLILCSSEWSLFTYVTGIRPRFYKVVFLIGMHIALSFFLAPYLGEVTVGALLYLAIISYKMADKPFIENLFFAFYPPILFSILWNFSARIFFPFFFNHSTDYFLNNFVWGMLIIIATVLLERFLREFYQINYISMKNSIWLDNYTLRNFWVTFTEMFSYYLISQTLLILDSLQIKQFLGLSLSTLQIIVAAFYLAILMKVLILIDYYSREYLKEMRQGEQKRYLENLETYSQQIEGLYQSIRSFRHDYNNILLSLGGSIESGDIDLVTQVFDDIFRDNIAGLESKDRQAKLINILVPEVKSFLFIKVSEFERKSYQLNLDIPDVIVDCGVPSSAGLTIFSEMFEHIMPYLAKNPQASVTVHIKEENGLQHYVLELDPYESINGQYLPDLSVDSQKMLNFYKSLSFNQSIHNNIFFQELQVRRESTI